LLTEAEQVFAPKPPKASKPKAPDKKKQTVVKTAAKKLTQKKAA
jgi:hypothetical protein